MTEAVDDYTVRFLEPLGQAEQAALVAALAKLFAATPEGRRMPRLAEPVKPEPVKPEPVKPEPVRTEQR